MNAWGFIEDALLSDIITLELLDTFLDWDHHEYDTLPQTLDTWACPGCEYNFEGDDWKAERKKHKRTCKYYSGQVEKRYEHESSNCTCCIQPYHDSSSCIKIKATKVIF